MLRTQFTVLSPLVGILALVGPDLVLAQGKKNQQPLISITAPKSGTTFVAPTSIGITASATDPDGSVDKVEYYANGSLIATSVTPPFSFNCTNMQAGSYSLTARA